MGFDFGRALNDLLLPTLLVGGGYLLYKSGAGERLEDLFSSMNNSERAFDDLLDRLKTDERLLSPGDNDDLFNRTPNEGTPFIPGETNLGGRNDWSPFWYGPGGGDSSTTSSRAVFESDGSRTVYETDGTITIYDKVNGKTTVGGSSSNNSSASSNYSSSGGGSSTTSSRHYVDSAGNIRLRGGNK